MRSFSTAFVYDKGTNLVFKNEQQLAVKSSCNQLLNQEFDTGGNQLSLTNKGFATYNSQNQLIEFSQDDFVEYYTYAFSGERVKKVSLTKKDQKTVKIEIVLYVGEVEHRSFFKGSDLVYNGQKVIAKSGSLTQLNQQTETRIKSGHGQVAKITDQQNEGTTNYCYNLLNNIDNNSGLLDSEAKLNSYQAYYPYGHIALSKGNTNNKQLGFSGQELDSSGLNYYGYRYYDSNMARWTRPDPIGINSGQLNLYTILAGNPVNSRDEMGLQDPDESKRRQMLTLGFVRDMGFINELNEELMHLINRYFGYENPNKFNFQKDYLLDSLIDERIYSKKVSTLFYGFSGTDFIPGSVIYILKEYLDEHQRNQIKKSILIRFQGPYTDAEITMRGQLKRGNINLNCGKHCAEAIMGAFILRETKRNRFQEIWKALPEGFKKIGWDARNELAKEFGPWIGWKLKDNEKTIENLERKLQEFGHFIITGPGAGNAPLVGHNALVYGIKKVKKGKKEEIYLIYKDSFVLRKKKINAPHALKFSNKKIKDWDVHGIHPGVVFKFLDQMNRKQNAGKEASTNQDQFAKTNTIGLNLSSTASAKFDNEDEKRD